MPPRMCECRHTTLVHSPRCVACDCPGYQPLPSWGLDGDAGAEVVYRYLDREDRVLYVGMTDSLRNRDACHGREVGHPTPWYARAFRVELTAYSTREQARVAETRALHDDRPLHNKLTRSGK